MLEKGQGTDPNYEEAVIWYRKLVNSGDPKLKIADLKAKIGKRLLFLPFLLLSLLLLLHLSPPPSSLTSSSFFFSFSFFRVTPLLLIATLEEFIKKAAAVARTH